MTAKPPPVPPGPFRFNRKQYYELGRLGYFDGKRVELIYGEIVEMSPINWPHHLCVKLVYGALAQAFATGHFVDVQQTFPIPNSTLGLAPQPDVAVIPGEPRDYTDHPSAAALIVEVADTTLSYDTTTKAEMYATAGVPEYWVVDIENRQLHVYRDPQPLAVPGDEVATIAYHTHFTLAPTEHVSPLAAPHASIPVSELLS